MKFGAGLFDNVATRTQKYKSKFRVSSINIFSAIWTLPKA